MPHYDDVDVVDDSVYHKRVSRGHVQRGKQEEVVCQDTKGEGIVRCYKITLKENGEWNQVNVA